VVSVVAKRMNRDHTETHDEAAPNPSYLKRLREHRADLIKRYGITYIGVFRSYIRNEQHPGSDLDVLVR
jgi:predicted nucleotidyltransferase